MAAPDTPSTLNELQTPCMTVDLDVVKANCTRMIERAQGLGVGLRPHMKTSKTLEGGRLLTGGSCSRIVVSTVAEAEFFASGGFDDITYGHIITQDKMPRLAVLAQKLKRFHVFIDCEEHIDLLEGEPLVPPGRMWSVIVKINTGYNRAGINWHDETLVPLVKKVRDSLWMDFEGIYIHEGMCYDKQGEAVKSTADEQIHRLMQVSELLSTHDIKCHTVSVGSTPSCSLPGKLMSKVTEIHPGNYVFYDVQQWQIGSCKRSDIALRVATRVMAHYPQRNELIVDCGFTALSHDGKGAMPNGTWCLIEGCPKLKFVRISQEYGVITTHEGSAMNYENLPIGKIIYLIPYHACATAAMHPVYYVHSGENIVEVWRPNRGW